MTITQAPEDPTVAPHAVGTPDFTGVFAAIAEGAVERERERRLPFEQVGQLVRAGFTRATVPVELGGLGRSIPELFGWLIELAAADPNLPQILRAHFVMVELHRGLPDSPLRRHVLSRAGAGEVFGNAAQERGAAPVGRLATRLRRDGASWRLTGTKCYSTGSLFADWVAVTAEDDDDRVRSVVVAADAPGVELVDDWDGFGQRLTGSGTTILTDVEVAAELVGPVMVPRPTHLTAFVQLVLLATMAGVGRAIARDAAEFVRSRDRVFSQGAGGPARRDPLVQQVVGRLESAAFAAEAIVVHAVADLAAASEHTAGTPAPVVAAELSAVRAQTALIPIVLGAAGELFEVGGASATSGARRLDRHWRNARTLASHNPSVYQARAIGDHVVNGADLVYSWASGAQEQAPRPEA